MVSHQKKHHHKNKGKINIQDGGSNRAQQQEVMPTWRKEQQLSVAARREARAVLAAYGDFWNQLRFRKGWAEPPFRRDEVLPMLERAAELVACIREELDRQNPGFKLRMVDGSARELLHSVSSLYSPMDEPDRFVLDMVHATLQDGRGYVEGLTRERVDDFIRIFSQGELLPEHIRPPPKQQQPQATAETSGGGGGMEEEEEATAAPAAAVVGMPLPGEGPPPALEGGVLVRSSSVMREEERLHEGVERQWQAVGQEMGRLLEALRAGWARGNSRRLLALRRVMLDLETTDNHLQDLLRDHDQGQATTPSGEDNAGLTQQEEEQQQPSPEGSAAVGDVVEPMPVDDEVEEEAAPMATTPQLQQQQEEEEEEAPSQTVGEGEGIAEEAEEVEGGEGPEEEVEDSVSSSSGKMEEEAQEKAGGEEEEEEEEEGKRGGGGEGAIEIQKVADDVESLRDQIGHLTEAVQGLDSKALLSPTCNIEGERVLEALQGRCARFSQALLHGLNVLDDLDVQDKDKPLRKNQVLQIQQLIDDVEGMRERLRTLRTQLSKERPQQQQQWETNTGSSSSNGEPVPGGGEVVPPPSYQGQGAATSAVDQHEEEEAMTYVGSMSLSDLASVLAPHWGRMKMRPRVEWIRQPNTYVLQSYIPGMRLEDVQVTIGPRGTLTLKGYRGPSMQDLAALRQELQDPKAPLEAVLQAGAGRFGSFVENRRLPEDADLEGLEASYQGGILRVTIPRVHAYVPPPQYHHHRPPYGSPYFQPQYPAAASGGRGSGWRRGGGGRGGFWADPDLWW